MHIRLHLPFSFFCLFSVIGLPLLEIIRRQHGAYTEEALMMVNKYQYSRTGLRLSIQDTEELAARLQVGMSIIISNAERLRGISHYLCALHGAFRRNVLLKPDIGLKEPIFSSKQMALALEFYLQIDSKYF